MWLPSICPIFYQIKKRHPSITHSINCYQNTIITELFLRVILKKQLKRQAGKLLLSESKDLETAVDCSSYRPESPIHCWILAGQELAAEIIINAPTHSCNIRIDIGLSNKQTNINFFSFLTYRLRGRKLNFLQAVRSPFQCSNNLILQATGLCGNDTRSASCGPSYQYVEAIGQCRVRMR